MSEINKPEDTTLNCPFEPSQYKKKVDVEVDGIPPVGSLPWALIQVYLGKVLSRSKWNANEYIQLSAKNDGSEPVHIEKHDKNNIPQTWEPTPEDLMACDWGLVKITPKPEDCMLSFELQLGRINGDGDWWGYISNKLYGGKDAFGDLISVQNETNITNLSILAFHWEDDAFFTVISSDTDYLPELLGVLKKTLYVTVDGVVYNLGENSDGSPELDPKMKAYFSGYYDYSNNAKNLINILQQTGQTKRFCFNWQ
ncbi:DUF2829 domain-containing protein [Xenorhabdus sp. XENO-10]|uniref:DUF2829 domain-containing protein n=1 Tax=Xenorhabdus yunnanensis TaxID=3025878 RepID=A0ABT5LKJ2_9GAMM|nr:MW1434 family type I TA system toxin [Xenorhabdus yunnanensis]MDC9591641.1 DUF2829 domain-containing protein [Xenorhabdus yunnanensis]